MSNLSLNAKKRAPSAKNALKSMRKQGRVPAIIYGLNKDPEMIEVSAVDMRPHLAQRNHVIELALEGGASQKVMIKSIERDPIRRDLVTTFGIPFGVKTQGGVFSVMKKFVKVRAKVQDIPDKFNMDVSEVTSGTIVYVKDLKFDKGTFVTPGKTALYGVTTGKAEAVEEAKPAAAAPAAGDAKAEAKPAEKKEEKKK
jgi:large subunit ribosomal protein L25